jgi:hypothetical protein
VVVSSFQDFKDKLRLYVRQFDERDLRWSYFIMIGVVLVCAAIHWFFRDNHGWTVWPFALSIAIMVLINEAADRAGQGVPPLQVYGFFIGAIAVILITVVALSAVNPLIILVGLGGLLYYCGRGYMEGRRREQIIASRLAEGLCVHCGEPADFEAGNCENCGEDPNPGASQLRNVQAASSKYRDPAKLRAVLKQESLAASAGRKEQALINKRRSNKPRK